TSSVLLDQLSASLCTTRSLESVIFSRREFAEKFRFSFQSSVTRSALKLGFARMFDRFSVTDMLPEKPTRNVQKFHGSRTGANTRGGSPSAGRTASTPL